MLKICLLWVGEDGEVHWETRGHGQSPSQIIAHVVGRAICDRSVEGEGGQGDTHYLPPPQATVTISMPTMRTKQVWPSHKTTPCHCTPHRFLVKILHRPKSSFQLPAPHVPALPRPCDCSMSIKYVWRARLKYAADNVKLKLSQSWVCYICLSEIPHTASLANYCKNLSFKYLVKGHYKHDLGGSSNIV
jgi:hypothetical protein